MLSPGLSYLEQVCQTLEVIARQQMQNRASEMEARGVRQPQGLEVSQAEPITYHDFMKSSRFFAHATGLVNMTGACHAGVDMMASSSRKKNSQ